MKSVQPMSTGMSRHTRLPRRVCTFALMTASLLLNVMLFSACTQRLKHPYALQSPYEHHELWAVAPFANESGVSIVDRYHVADLFTQQAQQIEGVDAIPVNRVEAAMRVLGLHAVQSEQDAAVLMHVLNADALIVGTVTAYDPYRPPKLGAAIELYRNDSVRHASIDPMQLTRSATGDPAPGEMAEGPIAQAAGVFDANNHQTLAWLEQYAEARTDPDSAYGDDVYLVSMDLYFQFVSYRLLRDLLEHERFRLTPVATADEQQTVR